MGTHFSPKTIDSLPCRRGGYHVEDHNGDQTAIQKTRDPLRACPCASMQVQERLPMLERPFSWPPPTLDRPDDRRGPDVARGTPGVGGALVCGRPHAPCGGGAPRPRRGSEKRAGGRAVCLPGRPRPPERRRRGGERAAGGGPPAAGTAPQRWPPHTPAPLCTVGSGKTPVGWRSVAEPSDQKSPQRAAPGRAPAERGPAPSPGRDPPPRHPCYAGHRSPCACRHRSDTTWKVSCNLLNLRKQFIERLFRVIFVNP
jgi:hypothetical protein